MTSLDITSLFTNVPLNEPLNICLNESFDKNNCVSNLDRTNFEKLLRLNTKEPSFYIVTNHKPSNFIKYIYKDNSCYHSREIISAAWILGEKFLLIKKEKQVVLE